MDSDINSLNNNLNIMNSIIQGRISNIIHRYLVDGIKTVTGKAKIVENVKIGSIGSIKINFKDRITDSEAYKIKDILGFRNIEDEGLRKDENGSL